MAKRLAALAIAAFAIVVSLDASSGRAFAADDCLSAPTSTSPPGQRWHYRLESGSNRHCWYLKGAAAKASSAATTKPSPAKTDARPDPVADLKSIAPAPTADAAAPQPMAAPKTDEPQPTGSPWPQPDVPAQARDAATDATVTATPAPEVVEDAAPTADAAPPSPTPDTPASAEPEKADVQIRMLLLAIVGALGFSGLLASTLFSVARLRQKRRQRDANWRAGIANTRRWQGAPLQDNIPAGASSPTKRVIGA